MTCQLTWGDLTLYVWRYVFSWGLFSCQWNYIEWVCIVQEFFFPLFGWVGRQHIASLMSTSFLTMQNGFLQLLDFLKTKIIISVKEEGIWNSGLNWNKQKSNIATDRDSKRRLWKLFWKVAEMLASGSNENTLKGTKASLLQIANINKT